MDHHPEHLGLVFMRITGTLSGITCPEQHDYTKEPKMKRNVELLQRTMQYIMDHPEQHDQRHWVVNTDCGTAACFAGWAMILSGRKITSGSSSSYIGREARELLGLTRVESMTLFCGDNTRPALQLMVKDLVNGGELRPVHSYQAGAGQ